MHWIIDADLALFVVLLESVALVHWGFRHAMTHWAHPWKSEADAVVVFVAGPVLLAGAAVGFLMAGMVITGIAEILLAVAMVGLVAFGKMKERDRRRAKRL